MFPAKPLAQEIAEIGLAPCFLLFGVLSLCAFCFWRNQRYPGVVILEALKNRSAQNPPPCSPCLSGSVSPGFCAILIQPPRSRIIIMIISRLFRASWRRLLKTQNPLSLLACSPSWPGHLSYFGMFRNRLSHDHGCPKAYKTYHFSS